MTQLREIPVKVEPRLPSPALPDADWADCYRLRITDPDMTAMDAAKRALGHFPPWVRALMAIRNAAMAPFGVRSTGYDSGAELEMIGLFPVVAKSANQVVLGFDDKHLDFRIVVDVSDDGQGKAVSVTTLVKRKILLGKVYIAVITPFHNLVVSSMLASVGRRPAAVNRRR